MAPIPPAAEILILSYTPTYEPNLHVRPPFMGHAESGHPYAHDHQYGYDVHHHDPHHWVSPEDARGPIPLDFARARPPAPPPPPLAIATTGITPNLLHLVEALG